VKEKRSCPRLNTAVRVQDMTTLKTRWTKNLSPGGCLIEMSEESDFLPMDCWLTLKIEIPGVNESIIAFGTVRHRWEHRGGYGIQFEVVDKRSAYYIERFIGTFL